MSKLIALFYYFIFVSVISARITNEGFLLLGGEDNGGNYLDDVEAYGSNLSLPSLPSLPFPLLAPIAEMTESGAVYLAGGGVRTNNRTFILSSLSSSKWEEIEARMPVPVTGAASVVVGDIVLVLGGWNHNFSDGSDVIQMLNTNKSLPTWKLLNQTLPERLQYPSAAVFEGQVIIVTDTGVTYTTSVSSIISDTKLDWVKGELPGVEGSCMAAPSVEVIEGKLVAVCKSKVLTKTTMDSQWLQLEDLPEKKRDYPSIGLVGGNIVIAGGYDDDDGLTNTVFIWLEASSEWKEVRSLKIKRRLHATVQLPKGTTNITQEQKPTTSTNRTPSSNN